MAIDEQEGGMTLTNCAADFGPPGSDATLPSTADGGVEGVAASGANI